MEDCITKEQAEAKIAFFLPKLKDSQVRMVVGLMRGCVKENERSGNL